VPAYLQVPPPPPDVHYRPDTARARGELAARLLADAVANGVSVEDDAALADLMASVPFDEDVPAELFEAVALILRHVLDLPRSSGG